MDNSFQLTTSAFFQPGNWRRFRQKKSAKFMYFSDSANLTQFHFVPLTKSLLQNLQEKISTLMKKEILLNLQHIIKLQKLCNFFCQNLHQYPSPKWQMLSTQMNCPCLYALFMPYL